MPAFRFKMQNILDIKEKLESQQKMEYARANQLLMLEQDKLSELVMRRKSYEIKLKEAQTGDLDLTVIQFMRNAVSSMKNMIQDQMVRVNVAQRKVDAEREKLDLAMQERKTYEKLKERAFDEFKTELIHKESKETDELVAYTYHEKGEE